MNTILREFPRGEGLIGVFFLPLEVYIYTNLFQNYIDGLDYDSHIPTCTSVDPPLRKMIQQNFFLFQNLVDIPVYFLKGWNIPKNYFKIISTYTLKIISPGSDPVEIISSEKIFWCNLTLPWTSWKSLNIQNYFGKIILVRNPPWNNIAKVAVMFIMFWWLHTERGNQMKTTVRFKNKLGFMQFLSQVYWP